jgi:hypothetical protein
MVLDYKLEYLVSRYSTVVLSAILIFISAIGCKVSYSFSGASIPAQVKTIGIQYFQNRASLVQPGLSQYLSEALIDKCKAQTNLSMVNGTGDVSFEGEITDYSTAPLTVSADATAAMNRFTISVRVRFKNSVDPTLSYEQTFSRYKDYDSNLDLSQVEAGLSKEIVELLVEDIFNQAFVNW